jgi:ATP-dependent RNA helicase DDX10/DBP4
LSKRASRGEKLRFDDDGVAHPVYDLVTEEEFMAQGSPEVLKKQFVEETSNKMRAVDADDWEEAREKKRAKMLKRKGMDVEK